MSVLYVELTTTLGPRLNSYLLAWFVFIRISPPVDLLCFFVTGGRANYDNDNSWRPRGLLLTCFPTLSEQSCGSLETSLPPSSSPSGAS